jgi:hypothetical protein
MDDQVELIVKLVQVDHGNDFYDRYLRPKDVSTYTFETNRERYVWQINNPTKADLIEGTYYKIHAIKGKKLFGGRGIALIDVVITSYI